MLLVEHKPRNSLVVQKWRRRWWERVFFYGKRGLTARRRRLLGGRSEKSSKPCGQMLEQSGLVQRAKTRRRKNKRVCGAIPENATRPCVGSEPIRAAKRNIGASPMLTLRVRVSCPAASPDRSRHLTRRLLPASARQEAAKKKLQSSGERVQRMLRTPAPHSASSSSARISTL